MHDDPRDTEPNTTVPPLVPAPTPPVREIDSPVHTGRPAGRSAKATVVGALVVGGSRAP
jgi:hypothetical protein